MGVPLLRRVGLKFILSVDKGLQGLAYPNSSFGFGTTFGAGGAAGPGTENAGQASGGVGQGGALLIFDNTGT